MVAANELLQHARGKALLGDTGYDSDAFRAAIRAKGMEPVIHPKSNRKKKLRYSKELYQNRYLVECFFHSIKRFRAIATRYEKTARNYLAFVQIACSFIWWE